MREDVPARPRRVSSPVPHLRREPRARQTGYSWQHAGAEARGWAEVPARLARGGGDSEGWGRGGAAGTANGRPGGPILPGNSSPRCRLLEGRRPRPRGRCGEGGLGGPLFSVPLSPGLGAGLPKLSHSVTAGCVATWPPPGRIHPFPEAGLSNEVEGTKARGRWLLFYKTLYAPCASPSPRLPPALIQP